MEEVFANQLVTMVKGLPFGDIFQEASGSSQPGSGHASGEQPESPQGEPMDTDLSDRPQGR